MKARLLILAMLLVTGSRITVGQINRHERPVQFRYDYRVQETPFQEQMQVINQLGEANRKRQNANQVNTQTKTSQISREEEDFEKAVDKTLMDLEKINDDFNAYIASFLEFPEKHNNAIMAYDYVSKVRKMCDEVRYSTHKLSDKALSNPKVQYCFSEINRLRVYSDAWDELLRNFTKYSSAGLTQNQMNILDPIFKALGWKITLLDINCKDAYFYEYQFKEFKMLFIKNALPPENFEQKIYNQIKVEYNYEHKFLKGLGGWCIVGGGLYRMIQYKNDENPDYYKLIKATSERR